MPETFRLGDIAISVTRKAIKHVHLSVYPPAGLVSMVAPRGTRLEVARAYAVSKLGWIREQQAKLRGQAREGARKFVGRETHYIWGRRYLLEVREADVKPSVKLSHRKMTLSVRPGSTQAKRAEVMYEWHRQLLHEALPPVIKKWEARLKVKVSGYFLQRMKTRWGGCNCCAGNIRINTELVKKPKDLLDYVVLHEMLHLITPKHDERFLGLLTKHYPNWREARQELNDLPLGHERWQA